MVAHNLISSRMLILYLFRNKCQSFGVRGQRWFLSDTEQNVQVKRMHILIWLKHQERKKKQQCHHHKRTCRAETKPSVSLTFTISKGRSFHSATLRGKMSNYSNRFLAEMVLTAVSVSVLSDTMMKKRYLSLTMQDLLYIT